MSPREDDKSLKWSTGRAGEVLGQKRDPKRCGFIVIVADSYIETWRGSPGGCKSPHGAGDLGSAILSVKCPVFVQLAA